MAFFLSHHQIIFTISAVNMGRDPVSSILVTKTCLQVQGFSCTSYATAILHVALDTAPKDPLKLKNSFLWGIRSCREKGEAESPSFPLLVIGCWLSRKHSSQTPPLAFPGDQKRDHIEPGGKISPFCQTTITCQFHLLKNCTNVAKNPSRS